MRFLRVPLIVAVVAAALAFGLWLGRGDRAVVVAPATAPPTTLPEESDVTFADLMERARPDADGRVAMSVTDAELTSAARSELPADAPIEDLRLQTRSDDRAMIDFSAAVRDGGLEVTGTVALDVVDGLVEPELIEARAGPVALPGSLRGPIEEVVGDATAFFDTLAREGVVVTRLDATQEGLRIEGQVTGTPR